MTDGHHFGKINVYLSLAIPRGMIVGTISEIDGVVLTPRVIAVFVNGGWVGDPSYAQDVGFSSEDYPDGLESLKAKMNEWGIKDF